jgi:hypothetical protein
MKILELFAGTKSIGKVAEARGHEVFSVDIMPEFDCSLTKDILDLRQGDVPFIPDMIWASPPCTYFSVASIGKHWNKDNTPKTDQAVLGMDIVNHTWKLICEFGNIRRRLGYSDLIFFAENPRGKLRKLNIIPNGYRETVTYCQYGDTRMKPTDIWTNSTTWKPRPICKNGDPCHESAPRGSRTGTQGIKGNKLRSVIPEELCLEIIIAVEDEFK